jgi:dynein heavy chain 1
VPQIADKYELPRAVRLVEAISHDFAEHMASVLSAQQLMQLPFADFERETLECPKLFTAWDTQLKGLQEQLRELAKKRGSQSFKMQPHLEHVALQDRLQELLEFRRQHEKLRSVITRVLVESGPGKQAGDSASGDSGALQEVNNAYQQFLAVDVLDVSTEGAKIWLASRRAYDVCIDRVEGRIISKLTDKLAATTKADDMFRVFSKFNALFFRPRIKGAIQQFQMRLIDTVKNDVSELQGKFRKQYVNSEAKRMSVVRDLPPISGAIIWARQIERQLAAYMQRIEDVLGKGWQQHVEGRKLKEDGDAFLKKIDTQQIFNSWLNRIADAKDFEVKGMLLAVDRPSNSARDPLQLHVAFDAQIITLFKEVRNLEWLGFRVPYTVKMMADEAKEKYPLAMSLQATLRSYRQACSKEAKQPAISLLLVSFKQDVHLQIEQAFKNRQIKWEVVDTDKGLTSYVTELANKVAVFHDKVEDVLAKYATIQQELASLRKCEYTPTELCKPLAHVQKLVDEMNLAGYRNLAAWVTQLDGEVEVLLTERLTDATASWVAAFNQQSASGDGSKQQDATAIVSLQQSTHQVLLRNQVMYLDPPLEQARLRWVQQLHQCIATVCELPRLLASRYDEGLQGLGEQEDSLAAASQTFSTVLSKLPAGAVTKAYAAIDEQLGNVEEYVQSWLQYQSLWDMQITAVTDRLENNLELWQQLVLEIKRERSTFDTSEAVNRFGPIEINYSTVQNKVNEKYDIWHREVLQQFAQMLAEQMRTFLSSIASKRQQLEQYSLDSVETEEVVALVTLIQSLRRQITEWTENIAQMGSGNRLLQKQRFAFPSDWLDMSQVEGEWTAMRQILERKAEKMEERMTGLQSKIMSEATVIDGRVKELLTEWTANKPLKGSLQPRAALETLRLFETRVQRLDEQYTRITRAKEALELDAGVSTGNLPDIATELSGIRDVWTALSTVSDELDELKETPWSAVVATKIRKKLEELLSQMKEMPNRIRVYEAFESMQSTVRGFRTSNNLVGDLKSGALKDRHWSQLMGSKLLNLGVPFSSLTLGLLWNAGLQRHEAAVRDVIKTAQGEMALEEFLRQVRDYWTEYELELANYQNRCRLVRGWGELFEKLDEHLSSLSSMAHSPYYQVFAELATAWTDRLTQLRMLFDIWIDVQRKWIYLQGIFFGSADIKQQLPKEFGRFKTLDNEFVSLMRKVSYKPNILEVAALPNLAKQLEQQFDLLNKIQKALGEYLERQRQLFSRFYFVGDEDLLEIIGNGADPNKVQRHFSKMFAGITSVKTEENVGLTSMISREGEVVNFETPILVASDSRVDTWLLNTEYQMQFSLASSLQKSLALMTELGAKVQAEPYFQWTDPLPAQTCILSTEVAWSQGVEKALAAGGNAAISEGPLVQIDATLVILSERVLQDLSGDRRKKYEQLITTIVHQRDVTRKMLQEKVSDATAFVWLYYMRYYWYPNEKDLLKKLNIKMASASFYYGFEYLGVSERLVQTPLTDSCYLTLTQALHLRMGGNPFGPAGTGKTESVKALGNQFGRFVLVFNCDETFDFQAMGRLFVGLCQVGAWGCFDEFNRLEERILSAVSQQILAIQAGLSGHLSQIELIGKTVKLNENVGIFVTMNPGYAGRSNLPDNLKQLFRSIAMVAPDRELIAQVMLFSQGIVSAEALAGKIVLLFNLCQDQLSTQPHYDFGLRALKSVLATAGNLKRVKMEAIADKNDPGFDLEELEKDVLIQSTCDTVVPKLVSEDIPVFSTLLGGVFPGIELQKIQEAKLREIIPEVCKEHKLIVEEPWMEKALQLYQVQKLRHGVMLVGPSGTGKTAVWKVLMEAMEKIDGIKGDAYVIDAKAIGKDGLYGTLDSTTLEWTDGVFTSILRSILNNVRGESTRRHWIVFDGDVDPEWAENLNSVLDDNKLLTLPSGERLQIPSNVLLLMETETLRYATLATVSRCGMVWFSDDVLTDEMIFQHELQVLRLDPLVESDGASDAAAKIQEEFVQVLESAFAAGGMVQQALAMALEQVHIMEATRARLVLSLFSLLAKGVSYVVEYNASRPDFPMQPDHLENYANKWLLFSVLWGFAGSMNLERRMIFGSQVQGLCGTSLPDGAAMIDFEVDIDTGEWRPWSHSLPKLELEAHKCLSTDVVVTTIDTIRHMEVLRAWLAEHRPVVLCGPPGSGKTMSLTATLQSLPELELASLNFSSGSTPELILKTFSQYCEYKKTPEGVVLQPMQHSKWLVVFCDEINLPANDAYGTQSVIMFLRELTEQGGFWRTEDNTWVTLKRIQFVGACNPPTDPGRVAMSLRFMRHTPILLVDFPAPASLHQIYGTFNSALLKLQPSMRANAEPLTSAMVGFYVANQKKFTADMQPHYIYSPRELSRWIRAMYEAIEPLDSLDLDALVRLWAHEGLRLFCDRLVTEEERQWCNKQIDEIAQEHFPGANHAECLKRPLLYSNWLSKNYVNVEQDELRKHVEARLKIFYEEELNVRLVVFDSVLDHVLRIDRVLRQPLGHLLLVGDSGSGKTVLTRFVAWMNGLSVFQVKVTRKYSIDDFDNDLRGLLKRAGCGGEKVCFIFDESNVLSSAFLERMNALLASGEIPGLFEADEFLTLMSACREAAQRDGVMLDTEEELFRRFTKQVQNNLHVVFTMNPAGSDLGNRSATSPALFNRCVVDWFGSWSQRALAQVAHEFTIHVDLDDQVYNHVGTNDYLDLAVSVAGRGEHSEPTFHDAVVASIVNVHETVISTSLALSRRAGCVQNFISPRDYLDLIEHFQKVFSEKRQQLEEQQLHLNIGLDKLRQTQADVAELQSSLSAKETELKQKDELAKTKLQQMVKDQNEAERRKAEALVLSTELEKQDVVIAARKQAAEEDLQKAEPALLDAQQNVRSIKKSQLDEIRVLARPPNLVKMTMEAVAVLLGEKSDDWAEIRKVIRKDDFIERVTDFDSEKITKKQRQVIMKEYLSKDEFNFEAVQRSSKACGPLFKWCASQISYSDILTKVEPLKLEVAQLMEQSAGLRQQTQELNETIATLEESLNRYTAEYAELINQTQQIKTEMSTVEVKCSRATALLASLDGESVRWEAGSTSFQEQMQTQTGDALIAASFLAYIGFFDHKQRHTLTQEWQIQLEGVGVPFKEDLSMIEYLSRANNRLQWHAESLPTDDLCIENAIILERFHRYPLVIDPAGQAAEYLSNHYQAQQIKTTSFLDASFMKVLASALRFGTPLLVQDVESIDPVLNPLLNKEFHKTGGRVLIRLGDEDIDFSPSFMMFLVTRDTSFQFAPDLCSRVTFVNFTVTPSSLQAQTLTKVLEAERPDVNAKRNRLLKLQGEYQARLRDLEEALLAELSGVQGNILDNDSVIQALETLKAEAAEVAKEAAQTDEVMAEVDAVSNSYQPLALACSRVYVALEQLSTIHFLYQFSLSFFMTILEHVLAHTPKSDEPPETIDTSARLKAITLAFFECVAARVSRGLLQHDKLMFALRLSQIQLHGQPDEPSEAETELLLRGHTGGPVAQDSLAAIAAALPTLNAKQHEQLAALVGFAGFQKLLDHFKDNSAAWTSWLDGAEPESTVPDDWCENGSTDITLQFRRTLLIRIMRPDRFLACSSKFVATVFSDSFESRSELDLKLMVAKESSSTSPLLFCSQPGNDPSGKVDALAAEVGAKYKSVAMGSAEGFETADKCINSAVKEGTWVLLRNIHLCPSWLGQLEKKLHNRVPHANFRIFLTSEIHPKLPSNLIRMSDVIVFEPPRGVKASLLRSLASMPEARMNRGPAERGRLYLMLAWFHAIVQERLRYAPVGWSKKHEFNDADQVCSMSAIDHWVDLVGGEKAHVAPEDIPWEAMRVLLGESLYGGRIDNQFDKNLIASLLKQFFTPKCFDVDFSLAESWRSSPDGKVESEKVVLMPEGSTKEQFLAWVQQLPPNNTPEWFGLPSTAESVLLTNQGKLCFN